jgi:hypothetical protein
MKVLIAIAVVTAFVLLTGLCAHAQEALWHELCIKLGMLYQEGRYAEAVTVAEEAIRVAENTFGKEHPAVAVSLNNLALVYHDFES